MTKQIALFTLLLMCAGSWPYLTQDSFAGTDPLKMDGYTHYGLSIDDIRKTIKYEEFTAEIIYSARLSDDLPGKYITIFYDEFARQMQAVLNKRSSMPDFTLRVEISNCRYTRTGYCGRNKKTGIVITSFINEKKDREISLTREEAVHPRKYIEAAQKSAVFLIGDK